MIFKKIKIQYFFVLFSVFFSNLVFAGIPNLHSQFYNSNATTADVVKILEQTTDPVKALQTMVPEQSSKSFTAVGSKACFQYNAKQYQGVYGLCYYFPKSLGTTSSSPVPALMFLHGGGASTSTYQSAIDVALMYMDDFIDFAEKNKIILIFPASQYGWAFHTRFLIREILPFILKELPIDSNKILLSGHSMGAMGITREGAWVTDQFSGYLALSGGTQPQHAIDSYLKTYFNTTYLHVNGIDDHFSDFDPLMKAVQAKMKTLETNLGFKSGFTYMTRPGGHNYDLELTLTQMTALIQGSRNLSQKRLFPVFYGVDFVSTSAHPTFRNALLNRYHWVEVLESERPITAQKFSTMDVNADSNTVAVTVLTNELAIKKIRIYLNNNLVDLTKPVRVTVNGLEKFNQIVNPSLNTLVEAARSHQDPNFLYSAFIDVSI